MFYSICILALFALYKMGALAQVDPALLATFAKAAGKDDGEALSELMHKVKDVVHTKSSNKIEQIIRGVGFQSFEASTQLEKATGLGPKTLMKLLSGRKEKLSKDMPADTRAKFHEKWDDFFGVLVGEKGEEFWSDGYDTHMTQFLYKDSNGKFLMLGLSFAKDPVTKKYNFNSVLASGGFSLAKTMVITHNERSDFWHAKDWSSISYHDTHITSEESKEIFLSLLPALAFSSAYLLNSVVPLAAVSAPPQQAAINGEL